MPGALDVRPTTVLMLVLALCAALLALAPAGSAHAQAPAGVVAAATADLAEQLDADPAGLELLRSEAVVWSDGCLGVHEPDIACTTALVDGFVLWLSDGDVAYRYHTDATGSVVRLAESGIALGEVAGAPLPGGQVGPAPPPEPAPLPEGEAESAPLPEGEDEPAPLPEGEDEPAPPPEGEDEPAPPPEPALADDPASPDALPTSGSGGLANDTDAPAWVWAVIAAVALSAIATGGAYRLWLRSRRR